MTSPNSVTFCESSLTPKQITFSIELKLNLSALSVQYEVLYQSPSTIIDYETQILEQFFVGERPLLPLKLPLKTLLRPALPWE